MEKELTKSHDHYLLQLTYTISSGPNQLWHLLTSSKGLALWFPQLSRQEQELVFNMPDFKECLAIQQEIKNQLFSFDWFGAVNSFAFREEKGKTLVTFTEKSPSHFPNLERDLAGWINQNRRLESYFKTGKIPDIMESFMDCQEWVRQEIQKNC
ncbi:hypothetical protein A9Q68_07230 [Streptococcus bovimastitidis]|uniref:ATPase n=1 Tax=Streptococcus bovimastitidis TaxID=1856638 RepID=A0A1L8MLX3_9STRE|nr:hypothetical protein A9Q68_07230 [Streptococcus bovimastitidis]